MLLLVVPGATDNGKAGVVTDLVVVKDAPVIRAERGVSVLRVVRDLAVVGVVGDPVVVGVVAVNNVAVSWVV